MINDKVSVKLYQIRNLPGEDEVGHGPHSGDDGNLAQEEEERNNLVQDDDSNDVAHQTNKKRKKFHRKTFFSFSHF